jgi:hypothetical protein
MNCMERGGFHALAVPRLTIITLLVRNQSPHQVLKREMASVTIRPCTDHMPPVTGVTPPSQRYGSLGGTAVGAAIVGVEICFLARRKRAG